MHPTSICKTALSVGAILLLQGCSGADQPAETEQAKPNPQAAYHRVADDMRDIAALTYGGCENEQAMRRAMVRLNHHAAMLPIDATKALRLVDEVLADTRNALKDCP